MSYTDKLNILKKYLPPFVSENEVSEAILIAKSKALDTLQTAIDNLANNNWTGKGLKLKAKENKILYKINDSENDIKTRITEKFDIHKLKGTEDKVVEELLYVANSSDENDVAIYNKNECGFIIDVTYYDDDVNFVDLNKLIILNISDTTTALSGAQYGSGEYGVDPYATSSVAPANIKDIENTIKNEIVPIDVQVYLKKVS